MIAIIRKINDSKIIWRFLYYNFAIYLPRKTRMWGGYIIENQKINL